MGPDAAPLLLTPLLPTPPLLIPPLLPTPPLLTPLLLPTPPLLLLLFRGMGPRGDDVEEGGTP